MNHLSGQLSDPPTPGPAGARWTHPPLLRAPEKVRTIFIVTMAAAALPLGAGVVFFGYRAAWVAAVAMVSCAAIERLYFQITHTPSLLGRSHAYLTGLLLALTLPPFTPWYVVVIGSAFAIIIGKALFGGVGHFLWAPALVGRFAVAVIMPAIIAPPAPGSLQPDRWPVLAMGHLVFGDIDRARPIRRYPGWQEQHARDIALLDRKKIRQLPEGYLLEPPAAILARLTDPRGTPAYSALARVRADMPSRKPTALGQLPPLNDMLFGARPGEIGTTCAAAIIVAGLYLIYRNYIKWQLPVMFLLAAAAVAAVAPIRLAGPGGTPEWVFFPILYDGPDVPPTLGAGFTYVNYQLLSGGILLAAFFLATEMTSRPVTAGGQAIFGLVCGAVAMLLKLYLDTPIPAYLAVLAVNTLPPTIDAIWRPRLFGQRHFAWLRK